MKKFNLIIVLLLLSAGYLYFNHYINMQAVNANEKIQTKNVSEFNLVKNESKLILNQTITNVTKNETNPNSITKNFDNLPQTISTFNDFEKRVTAIKEQINYCGDLICSSNEKAKNNCCSDCGCAVGKVCNFEKLTCQTAMPPFSNSKINEIVTKFKTTSQDFQNCTYNSTYDSTLNDIAVRVITLTCADQSQTGLVINSQGQIITSYELN